MKNNRQIITETDYIIAQQNRYEAIGNRHHYHKK